ncbi:HAD family hydrolase [Spartinivicinus poritis]|uniref:HAD family hydrolase n=1 Tax=Spartinivicinus poritis TaxID=2994640 RepID=A0ABT5U215_9GAMM|nr:HAD family hydrolase [Spartinivicinus sp. A2-2]MDE1460337.1 HAD family hydrolase [Spartinivicinus sp. A2-2]
MSDKLLILDLDETLIHAELIPLELPHAFVACPYFIYTRPYLDEFLAFCQQHFKLAVWTTGNQLYADTIVAHLFGSADQLEFVWARDRCISHYHSELDCNYYIKDLKKVKRHGYDLEDVLVIDDSPEKLERQYSNLIPVAPYYGEPTDKELKLLMSYLASIEEADNIRSIDKRGWHQQVA